jgi:hypothetical protein
VQGRLREEALSFVIETSCAHCGEPIHIEMDSELDYRVREENADPHVYVPMVDFDELEDPSIIDAF